VPESNRLASHARAIRADELQPGWRKVLVTVSRIGTFVQVPLADGQVLNSGLHRFVRGLRSLRREHPWLRAQRRHALSV